MSELREACGVYGIYDFDHNPVLQSIYWGLVSQNHRGHQSHGLLTHDSGFHLHKALGLVPRIKSSKMRRWLKKFPGHVGIGNVRYTTSGRLDDGALYQNIQPNVAEVGNTKIAISFNGNIVNVAQLREEIEKKFSSKSASDADLLCKKICLGLEESGNLSQAVEQCMSDVDGAYSITGLTGDGELLAFRDPLGIKPLCMGFSEDKKIVAISSESVGLDINALNYFPETIKPGELIRISESGVKREQIIKQKRAAMCSFEFAYFSRPDSTLNGTTKYVCEIRRNFGRNLGKTYAEKGDENKLEAVIPIPDSANDAGYGFHEETGLPLESALRRHRYVTDRAFITVPWERNGILGKKINIMRNTVSGKKIALIDDSIVRGDTTQNVLRRMRIAGAKELHLYITFPKIISPCFYGIDMSTFKELIGTGREPSEVAEKIGADSVTYQSIDDLVKAIGLDENKLCLGCVTGKYPTPLAQKLADEKRAAYENGVVEDKRVYE